MATMLCAFLVAVAVVAASANTVTLKKAQWMDVSDTPQQRAAKLLQSMTIDEKLVMLHGSGGKYTGNVPANTRLNIPSLNLNDGPQGFRAPDASTTCWPSALTVSAAWDPKVSNAWGAAMGAEFWAKGANVQLGPGMNVARVPRNGRNFEYVSGEDPYLGVGLAPAVVTGIQSQHVIANCKHWIQNNQETNRGSASMNVGERPEFEIYYPPWKAASDAGLGSIMCSYNKINHTYSCENNNTLNTNLKERIGFDGWVMSDWGATHSTSINQGLDQEMPSDGWMGSKLKAAVQAGTVSIKTIENSVMRMLVPMFQMGLFDVPNNGTHDANVTSDAHNKLARELSAAGTVLVQNKDGVLPLKNVTKVALIGKAAAQPTVHGGGSGSVVPPYVISPLQGFKSHLGFAPPQPPKPVPYHCDPSKFEHGFDYFQPGNTGAAAKDVDDCCSQCGQRVGCNSFTFKDGTCWYKPNNSGRRPDSAATSGSCRTPQPPPPPPPPGGECTSDGKHCVILSDSDDATKGAAAATGADVAVVFVGTSSSEGSDRKTLALDPSQDALVEAVAKANKNTIVVVVTPGAVLMPWKDQVSAIAVVFMPGQEYGNAIADIAFGTVNPSGRLPITMPNKDNEQQMTQEQYPGLDNAENATYTERLLIGYRWYTQHKVTPAFPFGHGLSYTTFSYSNLQVSGHTVSFSVQNTGSVAGSEVTQLYIKYPDSAGEPPLQLRGFQRVQLGPKQTQTVSFTLKPEPDLSIWDINTHNWATVKGEFGIFVGGSSASLPLVGKLVN
eukprot:m.484425 g.484425  ORF g.484425 m.484425 type:complete len:780 (-) comp23350_c0_seq1:125-2464(-)